MSIIFVSLVSAGVFVALMVMSRNAVLSLIISGILWGVLMGIVGMSFDFMKLWGLFG